MTEIIYYVHLFYCSALYIVMCGAWIKKKIFDFNYETYITHITLPPSSPSLYRKIVGAITNVS